MFIILLGMSKSGNCSAGLLYLGENIHLGPTLPAFLSPNVAEVLVSKFGLSGIGTVDQDLELF